MGASRIIVVSGIFKLIHISMLYLIADSGSTKTDWSLGGNGWSCSDNLPVAGIESLSSS